MRRADDRDGVSLSLAASLVREASTGKLRGHVVERLLCEMDLQTRAYGLAGGGTRYGLTPAGPVLLFNKTADGLALARDVFKALHTTSADELHSGRPMHYGLHFAGRGVAMELDDAPLTNPTDRPRAAEMDFLSETGHVTYMRALSGARTYPEELFQPATFTLGEVHTRQVDAAYAPSCADLRAARQQFDHAIDRSLTSQKKMLYEQVPRGLKAARTPRKRGQFSRCVFAASWIDEIWRTRRRHTSASTPKRFATARCSGQATHT